MRSLRYHSVFFFFQAEDGIRDLYVTGVQTCALPISGRRHDLDRRRAPGAPQPACGRLGVRQAPRPDRLLDPVLDRKSTRLNSSHVEISYAVFCLKKKKNTHPANI